MARRHHRRGGDWSWKPNALQYQAPTIHLRFAQRSSAQGSRFQFVQGCPIQTGEGHLPTNRRRRFGATTYRPSKLNTNSRHDLLCCVSCHRPLADRTKAHRKDPAKGDVHGQANQSIAVLDRCQHVGYLVLPERTGGFGPNVRRVPSRRQVVKKGR